LSLSITAQPLCTRFPIILGGCFSKVTIGDYPISLGLITKWAAVGLTGETKALAQVRARFLYHVPYLERVQGVLDGVRRGLVGPLGCG
jgi:hypothetical protein